MAQNHMVSAPSVSSLLQEVHAAQQLLETRVLKVLGLAGHLEEIWRTRFDLARLAGVRFTSSYLLVPHVHLREKDGVRKRR